MLKIRAHHLLCTKGFHGLGYNEDFIKKMAGIKELFSNQPELEIELVAESDEICIACPHNIDNKCKKDELSDKRVREQDLKVLKALNSSEHTCKTVQELDEMVNEQISSFPVLADICGTCEWHEACWFYTGLRNSWVGDKK